MSLRALITAATAIAVALAAAAPAGATFPGSNGRIAYDSSDPTGSAALLEIWSVKPNGTGFRNLTNTPTLDDYWPSYSADGKRIVFSHDAEVAVMRSDGTHLHELTSSPDYDYGAVFSPDGKQIAWNGINLMKTDGSHQHSITASGSDPAWSPNRKWIAYLAPGEGGNSDVFKVHPDGSGARNLTKSPSISETDPDWAPDGRRLIYTHTDASFDGDIWVMRSDGSHRYAVVDTPVSELEPTFSPNGKLIAYVHLLSSNESQIWTASARGGGREQITTGPYIHEFPTWQPR